MGGTAGGAAIQRVAVIGAGLMGHGIALEFAVAGRRVAIADASAAALEQGLANLRSGAQTLARLGLAPRAACATAPERVTAHGELRAAVAGADLVIEAVSEDLPLKQRVFAELDAACGAGVVLASNTSTFMPSALCRRHPATASGFSWPTTSTPRTCCRSWKLVPHADTDPAVMARMRDLYLALGKRPVVLQREDCGVHSPTGCSTRAAARGGGPGGSGGGERGGGRRGGERQLRPAAGGGGTVRGLRPGRAGRDRRHRPRELWPELAAGTTVADLLARPAAAGDYGAKRRAGGLRRLAPPPR